MKTVIWWIRRDIRLQDNPALQEAVIQSSNILPLYIFDPKLLAHKADHRQSFLFEALRNLDSKLKTVGSRLTLISGNPREVLKTLVANLGAEAIFAEADYSPYARQRDQKIAMELPLWLVHGLTVFPPGVVVKNSGCPYTIFTPFNRAWKGLPHPSLSQNHKHGVHISPLPNSAPESEPIPLKAPNAAFPASTEEAHQRLSAFIASPIYRYDELRNRLDVQGTSLLSPYIRFGLISSHDVVDAAQLAIEKAPNQESRKNAEAWLNELIWREFYISILHHFPEVLEGSFRRDLRGIRWRNEPSDFRAWRDGLTGYPVVDAAMRQLKETGWMHNRARMITASFLVKDLLVTWQEGEAWFMENLVDGDPASNNGGWQWTSGVGTDAVPYFRIFNPVLQGEKFDPTGDYVRKWLPELKNIPGEFIHKPWMMDETALKNSGVKLGEHYPNPIVDHSIVKQRTMAAYNTGEPRIVIDGCR